MTKDDAKGRITTILKETIKETWEDNNNVDWERLELRLFDVINGIDEKDGEKSKEKI